MKQVIYQYQKNIITATNGGLLKLFWDIGEIFNTCFENKEKEAKEKCLNEIGEFMEIAYGEWLSVNSLESMCRFRALIPHFEKISSISLKISWQHFRPLLLLRSEEEFIHCLEYIIENKLGTKGIKDSLKKDGSKDSQKRKLLVYHEPFNIYSDKHLVLLQNLLTPKRSKGKIHSHYNHLIHQLGNLIQQFTLSLNSVVNRNYILCCWKIGKLLNESDNLKSSLNEDNVYSNEYATDMPNENLTERELELMKTFASVFEKKYLPIYFTELITWPYLEFLLSTGNKSAIFFFVRKAASEGMTLASVKKQARKKAIESLAFRNSQESLMNKLVSIREKRTTKTKDRNITVCDTIELSFAGDLKSKIRLKNIFQRRYIKFLSNFEAKP